MRSEMVDLSVFDDAEKVWRTSFPGGAVLPIRFAEGEDRSERLELTIFAAGVMANIMRQARVVFNLTDAGFRVECRPNFRTILDQLFALSQVTQHGAFAVHAYGKKQAENYRRVRVASELGFPLGPVLSERIDRFLELEAGYESSAESRRAESQTQPAYTGRNGSQLDRVVYQMWLIETPYTKTSMPLADHYVRPEAVQGGIVMRFFPDGGPEYVADARELVTMLLPHALATFAQLIGDAELQVAAEELLGRVPPLL